jgi:LPXTG-site transpeptidase (sortase) family protein
LDMFSGAKLSTANYDALLTGWDAQNLISSVDFGGGNSTYCTGQAARNNMTFSDHWMISDAGLNCATPFTVLFSANTVPANGASLTTGPMQISIEFNMDAQSGGGGDAANYTGNYLLVEAGANGTFDTQSCAVPGSGAAPDDTQVSVDSATYDGSDPFIATLGINGGVPLSLGRYRLFICGTTTIENTTGAELNEGVFDSTLDFRVREAVSALPATGFAPGRVTRLMEQPAEKAYIASDLWMEIPGLGVEMDIVGVPVVEGEWDVAWLGDSAGWLEGTAFPTTAGNTGITAHVWDADNNPGPFVDLKDLKYGDVIEIHAWGYVYTYAVRYNYLTTPTNTAPLHHEEYDWVTLLTCERYSSAYDSYRYRRVVRAVLVSVVPE